MADNNKLKMPGIVGARPGKLWPVLAEWKRQNPTTDWTVLVHRGLKRELAAQGVGGKRFRKLLAIEGEVAA